jgi:hypothetical protein
MFKTIAFNESIRPKIITVDERRHYIPYGSELLDLPCRELGKKHNLKEIIIESYSRVHGNIPLFSLTGSVLYLPGSMRWKIADDIDIPIWYDNEKHLMDIMGPFQNDFWTSLQHHGFPGKLEKFGFELLINGRYLPINFSYAPEKELFNLDQAFSLELFQLFTPYFGNIDLLNSLLNKYDKDQIISGSVRAYQNIFDETKNILIPHLDNVTNNISEYSFQKGKIIKRIMFLSFIKRCASAFDSLFELSKIERDEAIRQLPIKSIEKELDSLSLRSPDEEKVWLRRYFEDHLG